MQPAIDIRQQVEIAAPRQRVWDAAVANIADWFNDPEMDMKMRLEPWVGGRMFRDLGEGTGHLWAHVQVIKPPVLLELIGPMFVSSASISHVAIRLEDAERGTRLTLTHRAVGLISPEQTQGVDKGWSSMLKAVQERLSAQPASR